MTQQPPDAKPPEKASVEDQITDLAVKVFKTGGIAGAGIGGFWSLFAESNVPKAIASAAIGLGISYGAKLLQPVHESNQRRLEKAGKAIDKAIDHRVARVMGVEERYWQCQAWDCENYKPEGMTQHEDIRIPMLEDVYVPLEFDVQKQPPGLNPIGLLERQGNPPEIWDVLKQSTQEKRLRQIEILAWGGYGKTTLLKHIAYTYGKNQQGKHGVPRKIPFLLLLRKYRDKIAQENPPSLSDLITQEHIPGLPKKAALEPPPDWAKHKLELGEAIVMFDGFDEVAKPQRPQVARWITAQMRQYRKSVFIITSRPKAYTEQGAADRLEMTTRLWLKEFDEERRRDFVQKWYLCQERLAHGGRDTPSVRQTAQEAADDLLNQIGARQELKDLAKNPLLLNMIVTFHRRYPGAELPKRRVELYQEICRLQLHDRPGARKLETLLLHCEAQTILQMLALEMMIGREERLDRGTLLSRFDRYLKEQSETVAAKDFLEQVVQISELLVERESEEFEFTHLSFQEYLAAVQITQQNQESLLVERVEDDFWKSTILLYTALTSNPTTLLQAMVDAEAKDLAYQCLQETRKRVDPALAAQLNAPELKALTGNVETSRYQQLETYLRDRQWREADKETYRLMITEVGKEEGQWFDREDLLEFPCEALRTIDGLWVNHSNGHFGFSVQKEIYLSPECGGILDGQYHEEAWNNFCRTNGWRIDGEYSDPSYSNAPLSSPPGNLPLVVDGMVGVTGLFENLFSRIETCKPQIRYVRRSAVIGRIRQRWDTLPIQTVSQLQVWREEGRP